MALNKIDYDALKNSPVIGDGQTWQNVTSSRTNSTIYTNTTGKPIQLLIFWTKPSASGSFTKLYIDETDLISQSITTGDGFLSTISAIVPNGSTYRVERGTNSVINGWSELR